MVAARAVLAVAVFVSSLAWFGAGSAHACSCEIVSTGTIDVAVGAFVGTVVDTTEVESRYEGQRAYVAEIEVERDLKGNLADVIFVEGEPDDGGNCGITVRSGQRIAQIVGTDSEGTIFISGCGGITDDLLDSWQPPAGEGGVAEAFLTTWGRSHRIAAVDETGQRIAFGSGVGDVQMMGLCDGDEALVEVVSDHGPEGSRSLLEIRDLATFEITQSWTLPDAWYDFVECSLDPLDLRLIGTASGEREPSGYELVDGEFAQVASLVMPETRATRIVDRWPTVVTSRGARFEVDESYHSVFELPIRVDVPATGPLTAPDLGAGLVPGTPDGPAAPTTPWALILVPLAVLVGAVGFLVARKRQ